MRYPRETNSDEDMPKKSISAMAEGSPQLYLSYIIVAATQITPLASLFEKENKREYPKSIDVE